MLRGESSDLLVKPTISVNSLTRGISLICEQVLYLSNMNITAAWNSAVHYAHANLGTIAIATGSVAAMACPAILSAAVLNAAGLTVSGPVAARFPLLLYASPLLGV